MKSVGGIVAAGLILLSTFAGATEKIGLAKFIEYGINNKANTENAKVNSTFRDAVDSFHKDKYGFKLSYDFSQDIAGGSSLKTGKLSGSKLVPFITGSDLTIKVDQGFDRGAVLPTGLVANSLALSMSFDLPLTPEAYRLSDQKLKEKQRAFELAKLAYLDSTEKIIQSLIDLYVTYLDSINRFDTEKRQYELQKKLFNSVEAKYDLGQVSGFEVIKARVNMIQSESNFKANQLAFEENKRKIYQTLGLPADADVKFVSDIDIDFKVDKIDTYMARLRYNKDIQRAVRELIDQQINYEAGLNTFFKNITFSFAKTYAKSGINEDTNAFTASTSFSIPILDGGDGKIAFQSARDTYMDQQKQFGERVRTAHDKIVGDYNTYIRLKETRATLKLFDKYASEEYKISLDRYNSGTATLEEVQNALTAVQSVRNQIFDNQKSEILAGFQLQCDAGLFFRTEDFVDIK